MAMMFYINNWYILSFLRLIKNFGMPELSEVSSIFAFLAPIYGRIMAYNTSFESYDAGEYLNTTNKLISNR